MLFDLLSAPHLTVPIPIYATLWILVVAYVTKLVPVLIFDLFESGRYPEVAVLGCATMVIITSVTLMTRRLSQRFGLGSALR